MAGLGAGLVPASPAGPGQPVVDGVDGVDDQRGEQAANLGQGQRDQGRVGAGRSGPFVPGDHGQDRMGEHDQGGVSVPGVPPADLMLVQADRLAGLETGLSAPPVMYLNRVFLSRLR